MNPSNPPGEDGSGCVRVDRVGLRPTHVSVGQVVLQERFGRRS